MKKQITILLLGIALITSCAAKSPLIQASSQGDVLTAQKLIQEGANINEPDSNGYTPLQYAIWSGDDKIAKLLIDKGANVNAVDKYKLTPLMTAASYGYIDIVKLLIDKGADVNAKDSFGNTALMSVSIPSIAKILIDKGADVNAQNKTGLTTLHNIAGFYDNNNIVIAEYLLNKNASANLKDENGQTALRYAISSKNIDMVALIRRKSNSIEETESLYMNDALGKPSHYNPEKGMFDVPADKEQAYKNAVYDCNLMVTFDKGVLTMLTGPVGYLGSMAADAVMQKGKFLKCMAKMGFECKNNCSK